VTRSLVKATALRGVEPAECLRHVNGLLCPDNEAVMFTTVFYGILDTVTGDLQYSSGGHQLPYVLRAGGRVEQLPATAGMGLGVMDDARFETRKAALVPGDELLLYTDGISEALDPANRVFSEARLRGFLGTAGRCPPRELIRSLLAEVRSFAADAPQSDDVTVLALRFLGRRVTPPPPPNVGR
jgi:sigma-B regulation protein RsbU (phosphoserine phosphatase)